MCIAIITTEHPEYPLILLNNRDVGDGLTADGNQRAESNLVMPCDTDGINQPIIIDTASLIT